MKVESLGLGRYRITVDSKEYYVYNPSKEDKECPNKWMIRYVDGEVFYTLREAKEFCKNHAKD